MGDDIINRSVVQESCIIATSVELQKCIIIKLLLVVAKQFSIVMLLKSFQNGELLFSNLSYD